MRNIEEQLKRELVRELCADLEGWTQANAAGLLRLSQPKLSALRAGRTAGFSVGRLIRFFTLQGYNIDVQLKPMLRRYAQPRVLPAVTVTRFDRYGTPVSPTLKPK